MPLTAVWKSLLCDVSSNKCQREGARVLRGFQISLIREIFISEDFSCEAVFDLSVEFIP